ncbi:MAG: cyclodeaminase/cyclohydrolase family protein [Candidatus Omnitrophica bacterium]|nr:cyclodeaminase/cyclohydrolase family protein [Candidatus Omnitrophota bacterium]
MTHNVVYSHESLHRYLEDLSDRSIVPGGGSAAAVAASVGAALNLMVIKYSIKEGPAADEKNDIIVLRARQSEGLNRLRAAIDRDCEVFSELMRSLSSGGDTQKKYIQAAEVPMEICRECCAALKITVFLSENSNRNLITDVGCAANILEAAFSSAALNVLVNLKNIKDGEFVRAAEDALTRMTEEMKEEVRGITRRVAEGLATDKAPGVSEQ